MIFEIFLVAMGGLFWGSFRRQQDKEPHQGNRPKKDGKAGAPISIAVPWRKSKAKKKGKRKKIKNGREGPRTRAGKHLIARTAS